MNIISFVLSMMFIDIIISESINNTNTGIHIRIYDNLAEISQPISPYDLPITFSQSEWYDIRSDSIRLIGNCVNIRAQIISFNRTSLNGQKILIKRSEDNDTFTEGILIDETRNLVQDLIDNTFYTLNNDRIRYFSIPPIHNYSVDFVLETYTNEQLYLRYLQKNIKWKVRYDLLLADNNTNSILQAYADIRNDGSSSLMIDFAELVSGDINIQSSSSNGDGNNGASSFNGNFNGQQGILGAANSYFTTTTAPFISNAEELVGVYIFTINETFILDPRTNYILPMFCPTIDIERYGSIEKYFTPQDNYGNAQRAYRLRVEETFLPQGQVFVRESDRLVGESYWSDIAANDTNEFTLGQDPDLQYIEYLELNSRREVNLTNISRYTISTYTIDLHLINNKPRSINFDYRLKFYSQDYLKLKGNTTNNSFQIDGASIIGTFQLNANDEQQFKFTFET
jgi:hypothetical protein